MMLGLNTWQLWIVLIMTTFHLSTSYRLYSENMKCSYGERGSLTATCLYVTTPNFFKSTSYRFDHLDETLQCLNCSLKSIEPNTFDISGNQIKHLVLKESGIEELQQRAFVGLVFLTDLDLSHNSIRMVNPGTFQGVKKIETVNLRNNSITSLSNDGFVELGNLKTLTLSENKITDIQTNAFNGLKNIQILKINQNQISNLTTAFSNLTSLQYLDLSQNNIGILTGSEFSNLSSLLELKLGKNKIKSLPSLEFFGLPKLELLELSNNFLNQIEKKAFTGLNMLETLDLGNNQIVSIPEKIFQSLHGLTSVNLTYNRIEVFQISRFSGLPVLRVLDLSHNQIEKIDVTGIFPLHDLHSLDLSSNNLTDLNYVVLLHRMPSISYLALQDNYWPCDLEDEMNQIFSGENFKFILDSSTNGSRICNDNVVRKELNTKIESAKDVYKEALVTEYNSSSSHILIVLSIMILALGVLALSYGQYRISKELRFNPLQMRRRTTSEVKLFQSDIRDDDNEFPR